MSTIDIIIFLVYILGIVLFGISFTRKNKTSTSFTLGNQDIPSWAISMSIFATFVSSISYLALPGNAFLTNWNAFVFSLSIPIASGIAIKYFIPVFRKINSPSAYTYLEQRFGTWASTYASFCYLLTQVMRVGTILYLLAVLLHAVVGWNIGAIIIITGIVIGIYAITGGIQAVIWTDAIQGIILISGAVICTVYLLMAMPEGPMQIFEIANQRHKFSLGSFGSSLSESTFWVVLIYGIFINLQNFGIDQNYVQRYMISSSEREAKKSALVGGLLYIPVSALFLFIGTALFAFYNSSAGSLPESILQDGGADKIFPYFIINELPVGIIGLLVASIFAAGMSTISTSYNSAATVILTNYYNKFVNHNPTDKQSMRVLYLSSIIFSVLGIGVALAMINVKSALDAWWKLASIFSGGMLGLLLLGVFSKYRNVVGALIGVTVGLLLIIYLTVSKMNKDSIQTEHALHDYLTIVLGTSVIFILGFIIGLLRKR